MAAFPRLPEEERMSMTQYLQYTGGKEGREALKGIASQDPSAQVRAMAEAALKGGAGMGMTEMIQADPSP